MATLGAFLLVYVIGGLTFVPLCLAAAVYLAVLACPVRAADHHEPPSSDELADASPAGLPHDFKARQAEPDVAAAYFAVCREYVPGGVNGKPPERTTPAGAVVGVESPSVYQSMYRTIFDRNRAQSPSMEGAKNGKAQKKARNVFFVVLRHGHLILFDDSEQVEVRYVISLAHRIVDLHAGGDAIPEGELWIKRNCIRLRRTYHAADSEAESRPFYLFSDNCSEKEDFYFALLRNQERQTGVPISPPLQFEQPHVVKLVQQLHASEENLQTRWINALAGRLFLALYKTPNVEEFIRLKITKKIARVAKPAFIQTINIQRIVMGDSAPMITNPKLRELTLDGELTVEADIKYNGNFRLEIAAVARIDLGSRFKARYVNMVLAGILKKLEGHILIRMKPPPSNRFWVTFEHPPKMEMTIEPIVSSRQITYGMILRAIENRIREVVAETLVLPNWDDMPFFDTIAQPLRGGIWEDATKAPTPPDAAHDSPMDDASIDDGSTLNEEPGVSQFIRKEEKTMSMPNLGDSEVSSLKSRKTAKSVMSVSAASDSATSSGAEVRASPVKPKSMRSGSFASIARPVVAPDTATVEAQKSPHQHQIDAIAAMKDISSRSIPTSPAESPVGSPAKPSGPLTEATAHEESKNASGDKGEEGTRERGPSLTEGDAGSITDLFGEVVHSHTEPIPRPEPAAFSANSEQSSLYSHATDSSAAPSEHSTKSSTASRKISLSEKRQMLNMSLNSATTAAKKWFASRQQQSSAPGSASSMHAPSYPSPSFAVSSSPASATGTPARSSSPTHDQQEQQQHVGSQTPQSDEKAQQPWSQSQSSLDQTPGTPSSFAKPTTPSGSPPKPPTGPARSSSISTPMGRGQPLPPPGVPLPPPAKPENKWVQGSAQLLGLTKRKSVPPPAPSGVLPTPTAFGGGAKRNGSVGSNSSDGGNGNGGTSVDIAMPAATAMPTGMGKEGGGDLHQYQQHFGRSRTASSATPIPTPTPALAANEKEKEKGKEETHHREEQPESPASSVPAPASSTSPPPPPLPPRKPTANSVSSGNTSLRNVSTRNARNERRNKTHRSNGSDVGEPQLLVIAAPAGSDASAPATPEALNEMGEERKFESSGGDGDERESRGSGNDEDESTGMERSMFALDMDEDSSGGEATDINKPNGRTAEADRTGSETPQTSTPTAHTSKPPPPALPPRPPSWNQSPTGLGNPAGDGRNSTTPTPSTPKADPTAAAKFEEKGKS